LFQLPDRIGTGEATTHETILSWVVALIIERNVPDN